MQATKSVSHQGRRANRRLESGQTHLRLAQTIRETQYIRSSKLLRFRAVLWVGQKPRGRELRRGMETGRQAANRMVPGGRVELPTPAFSGPRSTGELPRHRGNRMILRGIGEIEKGRMRFLKLAIRRRNFRMRLDRHGQSLDKVRWILRCA